MTRDGRGHLAVGAPDDTDYPRSPYDGLPPIIKANIGRRAYEWLPDAAKHRLTQDLCEPDPDSENPPD